MTAPYAAPSSDTGYVLHATNKFGARGRGISRETVAEFEKLRMVRWNARPTCQLRLA